MSCVAPRRALLCAAALGWLLLAPRALAAQTRDSTRRDSVVQAGAPRAGDIVRTLTVERRPVFDIGPDSKWYERLMNTLHVTTRDGVVRREMLTRPGQPYDHAAAAETERNLRALNVFRVVSVDTARDDAGLGARLVTGDAFTFKPTLSLRTSGGQASYGYGLAEGNLLGRLINVSAEYRHQPDRSSVEAILAAPRIISDKVGVAFSYADLSDGRQGAFSAGVPFLSFSARSAFGVDVQASDGRVLRYTDGLEVPTDSLHRSFFLGTGQLGYAMRASPRGYTRIGALFQVRREDFGPLPRVGAISRTMTGAVLLQAEDRRAHFVVVRNYRNIGPDEDVDLSTTVRLGVSVAPSAWGYATTGYGPLLAVSTGGQFAHGFATLQGNATTLYHSLGKSAIDSGTFSLAGTLVLQRSVRHVAVLYAGAGRQVNPAPGAEFDMGLTVGPRAFPQHAFTGDRYFFGSAEYRYTVLEEWLKLFGVGVAAFVDHGGAWFGGSSPRTGTDLGLGLRVGSSRFASPGGAGRIDLSYRLANGAQPGGFVVSVGRGFAFDLTP